MEDSVQQLTDIVNDVLDMAKLKAAARKYMRNALTFENCVRKHHMYLMPPSRKRDRTVCGSLRTENRFYVGDAKKYNRS